MKSIRSRIEKLEKGDGFKRDHVIFSIFDNEDPDIKRNQAIDGFVALHGRQPGKKALYIGIRKIGLAG